MTEATEDQHGPSPLSETGLRFATWLVTGAMFMEILDGTIITTALPAMARSFGTTALQLNVGISAYLLALGVFIPLSGWVADRMGTRHVFAAAIALFTISSAACGATTSLVPFVTIRVVQGIAGAMMVPVGRLVILRFTPRERLMATMASLVWPALIAPVLGPPVGGFITTHFGWRWIFYLNVPLGLAALVATMAVIPQVRGDQPRRFDLPGFLLSSTGTFALLAGLEWSVEDATPLSIAFIVAGLVLVILAFRHFARSAAPMIDLASYRIETFRASLRGGSLTRMTIGSAPFLLPLLFQVGFGYDAFHSGLLVLAVFAGNLLMKAATTPALKRFGYRNVLIWNGVLAAATLGGCAFLRADTPMAVTVLLLFAGGLSRSMQFTAISTIAFADIPKSHMSDANSLFNTIAQISMAAGITLGAMAVRVCQWLAAREGQSAPDIAYRGAFMMIAIVALVGLIEAVRLPRQAGDNLVSRASG